MGSKNVKKIEQQICEFTWMQEIQKWFGKWYAPHVRA